MFYRLLADMQSICHEGEPFNHLKVRSSGEFVPRQSPDYGQRGIAAAWEEQI
jgi:hypothetical protein